MGTLTHRWLQSGYFFLNYGTFLTFKKGKGRPCSSPHVISASEFRFHPYLSQDKMVVLFINSIDDLLFVLHRLQFLVKSTLPPTRAFRPANDIDNNKDVLEKKTEVPENQKTLCTRLKNTDLCRQN